MVSILLLALALPILVGAAMVIIIGMTLLSIIVGLAVQSFTSNYLGRDE